MGSGLKFFPEEAAMALMVRLGLGGVCITARDGVGVREKTYRYK